MLKHFDAQFILKYLVEKSEITEAFRVILNKNYCDNDRSKFIDSSNYMLLRLSDLTKVSDCGILWVKIFFPHLFNTLQNQNDITFYDFEMRQDK